MTGDISSERDFLVFLVGYMLVGERVPQKDDPKDFVSEFYAHLQVVFEKGTADSLKSAKSTNHIQPQNPGNLQS